MNGLVDKYCTGCIHIVSYRGYGVASGEHCNCFLNTGRLRGCPAGKGCTKKETKKRKAALGEVMALFKQWQNIRNQLLGAVNGLDWENKDKMTKAMRAQIKMWSEAEG